MANVLGQLRGRAQARYEEQRTEVPRSAATQSRAPSSARARLVASVNKQALWCVRSMDPVSDFSMRVELSDVGCLGFGSRPRLTNNSACPIHPAILCELTQYHRYHDDTDDEKYGAAADVFGGEVRSAIDGEEPYEPAG